MTQTTILNVKDIMYANGLNEITVLTPAQWAGRMSKKGYRKTIITVKTLAHLTIKIKTK